MAESSSEPSMYVRVKRKKTAIFLMVEPTDTASDLKIKIHHITKVATTDMKLYLDAKGEVQLDENKSLADQKARRRAAPARRANPALLPPPRPHCAPRPPRLRRRANLVAQIDNDQEMFMVYKKEGGEGEWEEIDIASEKAAEAAS
jgi:hypothetical protein